MQFPHRSFLLLLLILLSGPLMAEGTREVAPNANVTINGNPTNDIAALHLNHPLYDRFGQWGSDDVDSRLHVTLLDPANECLYIGFSPGHLNGNDSNPPLIDFMFRILDPMGNVVYGPIAVFPNDANISDWSEGMTGPEPLAGPGGYIPYTVASSDLISGGWTDRGDYYIEFQNLTSPPPNEQPFLIDYWDITVVDCSGTFPQEKRGRVWSYNWSFFAINDFGFPNRPFNGAFYVCAPDADNPEVSFVTRIDFNQSGFRPAAFNITFNSFGTMNTGNVAEDRKSVENANTTIPEYAIYLNDPVDLCETATAGSLELNSIDRCGLTDFCINLVPNKAGQVDILLDFNGQDGEYTPGTADRILVADILPDQVNQPICLVWDGRDGLGAHVDELGGGEIPIVLSYAQGIYHFPIYDAEIMESGFQIDAVRPPGPEPLLFYDDSNISTSSGSGEPAVNLNGCTLPCHAWTNYTNPDFIGFGNLNTINSWWFSQQQVFQASVDVPNYLLCEIDGVREICEGDTVVLSAVLNSYPDSNASLAQIDYQWEGAGIAGPADQASVAVSEAGEYSLTIEYPASELRVCTTSCSFIIMEDDSCCVFDVQCPPELPGGAFECEGDIPAPYQSIGELVEAGLSIHGEACGPLALEIAEETSGEDGCVGRLLVDRIYTVFEDINENGAPDPMENAVQCEQHFSVWDTIPPEFTFTEPLPGGIGNGDTLVIQCTQAMDPDFIPDFTSIEVTASDNCVENVPALFFDTLLTEPDCSIDGTMALFRCGWTAADLCENEAAFVFFVRIVDTIPPVFAEELTDQFISCDADTSIQMPEALDECSCAHVTFEEEITDVVCEGTYTLLRTFTLEDHCGNTSKEIQKIHVSDEEAPQIWFIDPALVETGDGGRIYVDCSDMGLPEWVDDLDDGSVLAADNCSDAEISYMLWFVSSGLCETDGYIDLYRAEWTATDDCGNASSLYIEFAIVDGTPPVFTEIPPSNCVDLPGLESVGVTDDCGGVTLAMEIDSAASNCSDGTDYTITWVATDLCGNQSTATHTYHIGDDRPPVLFPQHPDLEGLQPGDTLILSCPPPGVTSLSGFISSDVLARDRCDLFTPVEFEEELIASGPCGGEDPFFLIRVRWSSVDECGNEAEFEIFVEIRDEMPPEWPDFQEEIEMDCEDPIPEPALTDNCSLAELEIEDTVEEGQCPVIRTIHRRVTAADECENVSVWEQTIYVVDRTPPDFDESDAMTCDPAEIPKVADACDTAFVDLQLLEESTMGECDGGEILQRTWQASDRCQNTSTFRQTVVTGDQLPPQIKVDYEGLSDVSDGDTMYIDCLFATLDEDDISAVDGCSEAILQVTIDPVPLFDCLTDGFFDMINYGITATDVCGNQSTLGFTLVYLDQTPPYFASVPEDMTVACYIPDTPSVEAYDYCAGVVDIAYREEERTNTNDELIIERIWTATDACGNSSEATQLLTISDPLECSISVEEPVPCFSDSVWVHSVVTGGNGPYSYHWKADGDDCRILWGQGTGRILLQTGVLDITLYLEVTDADGCVTTCMITIDCMLKKNKEDQERSAQSFDIQVFPNPFGDELYLEVPEKMLTPGSVRIYSKLGALIREIPLNAQSHDRPVIHLKTGDLSPGIYFLEIPGATGNTIIRPIVKM